MKVEKFFDKAKKVCNIYFGKCSQCPIGEYCSDGIFASNSREQEEIIKSVKKSYQELQNNGR